MVAIALFCMGLQAVVSLAVGLRLLALARRTRRFPELALSLYALLAPALGYPALMVAVGLERLGLPGVVLVFYVATSVIMAAVSMNYFFTWRVFHPGSAFAVTLCGVGTWLMLAPLAGVMVHIDALGIDEGIRSAPVWEIPIVSSVLTAFGWTGVESFRYYLNARRRLRVGLVDAAVCNRFLLWALASSAWLCLTALSCFLLVQGVNPLNSGLFNLGVGATGLLNGICMMLCFMPPEGYLAWLRHRAAIAQGA